MGRRPTPRRHFPGCRTLPYIDDFLFSASSLAQAYAVRDRATSLLEKLALGRHPDKGQREPAAVPTHRICRSIYKSVETVYMHLDNSGYGWGASVNETTEARGFRYDGDRELHITHIHVELNKAA
eukprot:jgi/Tetstr1/434547/TSEL_023638.t1